MRWRRPEASGNRWTALVGQIEVAGEPEPLLSERPPNTQFLQGSARAKAMAALLLRRSRNSPPSSVQAWARAPRWRRPSTGRRWPEAIRRSWLRMELR